MESKIPTLNEAFRDAKSGPEIILNQIDFLKKDKDSVKLSIFSNKLKNYYKYITDKELLKNQKEHFETFYDELIRIYPDMRFRMSGRWKSLISAYIKIWSSSSATIIKDIAGFRIVIFGDTPEEMISQCYMVLEHLFWYSIEKGFIPCEAERPKDTSGFIPEEHPDIIVPDTIPLKKDIIPYVKDYISHPKKNGYQSLHIIFKDAEWNFFEVQIRTIFMHMVAENGKAAHDKHKSQYANLEIDRSLINIPGYYIQDGKLFDWVGIEESLEILRRQKTY